MLHCAVWISSTGGAAAHQVEGRDNENTILSTTLGKTK